MNKTDSRSANPQVNALVQSLTQKFQVRLGAPSLEDVRDYLAGQFYGADDFAKAFYGAMERSHWQDRERRPLRDWRAMARAYASRCEMNRRQPA